MFCLACISVALIFIYKSAFNLSTYPSEERLNPLRCNIRHLFSDASVLTLPDCLANLFDISFKAQQNAMNCLLLIESGEKRESGFSAGFASTAQLLSCCNISLNILEFKLFLDIHASQSGVCKASPGGL